VEVLTELEVPFEAPLQIVKQTTEEDGKWIVEGFATTSDLDLEGEVISDDAIEAAANDLKTMSTVLLNHDRAIPIGTVLDSRATPQGLWVKVLISKTKQDIWTQITEGVLNKFSIRALVLGTTEKYNETLKKNITVVTKMRIVEVSLVSIPANPAARALRHYVAKAMQEFRLQKGGGSVEVKKEEVTPKKLDEKTGEPLEKVSAEASSPEPEKTEEPEVAKAADAPAETPAPETPMVEKQGEEDEDTPTTDVPGVPDPQTLKQHLFALDKAMSAVEDEGLKTALKAIRVWIQRVLDGSDSDEAAAEQQTTDEMASALGAALSALQQSVKESFTSLSETVAALEKKVGDIPALHAQNESLRTEIANTKSLIEKAIPVRRGVANLDTRAEQPTGEQVVKALTETDDYKNADQETRLKLVLRGAAVALNQRSANT